MKGIGTIAGLGTTVNITVRYNLLVNATDKTLFGSVRGRAKIARFGAGNIRSEVSTPLPAGMDGSWRDDMIITPLQKLGGSALLTLSNTRTVPMILTGSYSPHTDLSKVRLLGINENKASSLSLIF